MCFCQLLQARLWLKAPLESLKERDLGVSFVGSLDYIGEEHRDNDCVPCCVGVWDIGGCGRCRFQQVLCFPTIGSAAPLRHRELVIFDPTVPHGASSLRKSNPSCPCDGLRRFAVVLYCKPTELQTLKAFLESQQKSEA